MIDFLGAEGQSLAVWIQSLSNVFVLFLIYRQLGSFRLQMSQADQQSRAERAWQFMHFYQQELAHSRSAVEGQAAAETWEEFSSIRLRVFSLLNQLIRFQQVDERLLYGFLSEEFLQFVDRGTEALGQLRFADEVSPRIMFLIATWGGEERIYGVRSGASAEPKE